MSVNRWLRCNRMFCPYDYQAGSELVHGSAAEVIFFHGNLYNLRVFLKKNLHHWQPLLSFIIIIEQLPL